MNNEVKLDDVETSVSYILVTLASAYVSLYNIHEDILNNRYDAALLASGVETARLGNLLKKHGMPTINGD